MMENEESRQRIVYRSAKSGSLGPQWEVIQVILQREDGGLMRTSASVVLARSASGTIIRKTGILPDRWEQVTDDDALAVCQEFFDNKNRFATLESEHAEDPEVRIGASGIAEGADRNS